MADIDLEALKEPFLPWEIDWRIGRAGKNQRGIWAKVLAYVTSRAIMDRLDSVCGPENWASAFNEGAGHLHAGIGIKIGGEWVWKWDGTGQLDASGGLSATDAGKGDFSNAFKRAAVQWGIGRYLYGLDEGWANVHEDGEHYARLPKKDGGDSFRWDPPDLPTWALPEEARKGKEPPVDKDTGEIQEDEPLDPHSSEDAATEKTLKEISAALKEIEDLDDDKYQTAYKHYENQLDAILGSEEEAKKFLNRCNLTIEALTEDKQEAVPA